MQKNSFYIPHDFNARNDLKIIKLRAKFGLEGYAIFWILLEHMAERSTVDLPLIEEDMEALAFTMNVEHSKLLSIVNYCIQIGLFVSDDECFTSLRLQSHINQLTQLRESRSRGGRLRWQKQEETPAPEPTETAQQELSSSSAQAPESSSLAINKEINKEINKGDSVVDKSTEPKRFVKPTMDALLKYFYEINMPNAKLEAEKFYDHYEANGWRVGKNPMKSWQGAARNWKRNIESKTFTPAGGAVNTQNATVNKIRF